MARIFVSYAHVDEDFVDAFVLAVRDFYRQKVVVWYDEDLRGGDQWWRKIMWELFRTDIFIYIMSKAALNSPYCQAEFREAYRLRKQIITVLVDEDTTIDDPLLSAIQFVDLRNGLTDGIQTRRLFSALNDQLAKVPPVRLLPPRSWKATTQPNKPDKSSNASLGTERVLREPMDINTRLAYIQTIATVLGLVLTLVAIIPILQGWGWIPSFPTPTPTEVVILPTSTDTPTTVVAIVPTDTPIPPSPITPALNENNGATATPLSAVDRLATANVQATTDTAEMTAQAILDMTATRETATAQMMLDLTATESERQTQAFQMAETAAQEALDRYATATAIASITPTLTSTPTPTITPSPTATPIPTLTPLEQALDRARNFTGTRNGDWEPFSYVFEDGVERVLVPVGCFQMGSADGQSDEQPVHEQCITEPFWLDKYEVTNALYGSVGCSDWSSEPDQPRNCVTWIEAQAFCEAHGGNLPTEAQWEYAARGVESWVYPWGNEYVSEYVIGEDDPTYGDTKTAPVGSRPEGASWVGTLDQSGNLWEWTATRYDSYPYELGDDSYNSGDNSERVLRGGSFYGSSLSLRSARRSYGDPLDGGVIRGFRCARS